MCFVFKSQTYSLTTKRCLYEGSSDGKYRTPSASDFQRSLELEDPESSEPHTEIPDMAEFSPGRLAQKDAACPEVEPDADKENSPHNLEATHDISHSGNPRDASPEEEEEWEEEDDSEGLSPFLCLLPFSLFPKVVFVLWENVKVLSSNVYRDPHEDSSIC